MLSPGNPIDSLSEIYSILATVKTEIIGHHARTLELFLLVVGFVSQVRAERGSSRSVFPPNPEGEILDVPEPCPITPVFTAVS